MIFCINCGTQNERDAVFCLACGQTLYRSEKANESKTRPWRVWLWFPIGIIACLTVVALSLTVTTRRSAVDGDPQKIRTEEVRPPSAVTDKAVLTIVGVNRRGAPVKQGSGFILTSDGLGATNYHVLQGVAGAAAECCDKKVFDVRYIEGADFDKDLVVFQLYENDKETKPQGLPSVTLGQVQDSSVGEHITTIGSPEGLENTVSDGIISAIRQLNTVRVLQITAPISPGSSGGPVFSSSGEVIGVTTFQFEKGQNLNFAIAADEIRPLLSMHLEIPLSQFKSPATQRQHVQRATSSQTIQNPPPPESVQAITGQYAGIVHNLSANLSAQFALIVDETGGTVSGCMGVKQPLFGSGPLFGSVTDSEVNFVVRSAIGEITFIGRRRANSISGTYVVEDQNGSKQEGTFTLEKVESNTPSPPVDTRTCPTDAEMNQ